MDHVTSDVARGKQGGNRAILVIKQKSLSAERLPVLKHPWQKVSRNEVILMLTHFIFLSFPYSSHSHCRAPLDQQYRDGLKGGL